MRLERGRGPVMNGELVPGEEDRSGEGESGDRSLVNSAVGVVCGVSVRVRRSSSPFLLALFVAAAAAAADSWGPFWKGAASKHEKFKSDTMT